MKNSHTNSNIKCSVTNCTYHSKNEYCTRNQINIGACENTVTTPQGTQCASFQMDAKTY